jgi:16S rRNA (uracil1498-N3)-methyltransferase
MQLFYFSEVKSQDKQFYFDKEESKHIVKVLRKKNGDILHVTNGLGFLFKTEIISDSPSKCEVRVLDETFQSQPNWQLHLAVAPTKMNDRYEWFLEKATEIGIQEITPIICDHSERTVVKTERFHKVLLSAMKQSNQLFLPKLNEPISFSQFIKKDYSGQKMIAHCEETSKNPLQFALKTKDSAVILIGPEGDFSNTEIQKALDSDFMPISLGSTRLRTETAALVACHTFVLCNEQK